MTIQELVQRHADTVYTLFGSLFGTIPSISILMEMTGTPEILWTRDFPFSGKEQGPLPLLLAHDQRRRLPDPEGQRAVQGLVGDPADAVGAE